MALAALASVGLGLASGFAFGTGYGAGVRFGYEDVYPYLKGNMGEISKMLNIPFASSGFKLASGVTAHQGMGLKDAESATGGMGLSTPEDQTPRISPAGQPLPVAGVNDLPGSAQVGQRYVRWAYGSGLKKGYHHLGDLYEKTPSGWKKIGSLSGYSKADIKFAA